MSRVRAPSVTPLFPGNLQGRGALGDLGWPLVTGSISHRYLTPPARRARVRLPRRSGGSDVGSSSEPVPTWILTRCQMVMGSIPDDVLCGLLACVCACWARQGCGTWHRGGLALHCTSLSLQPASLRLAAAPPP